MRTGRILVPGVMLLSLSFSQAAQAQPGPERLEVAVNLSLLRASGFESTEAGIGGRVGFNLTNHIALEGDVDYIPNHRIKSSESRIGAGDGSFWLVYDHNRTTGLFGAKIGTYTPRFGAFAKARPGFTHSRQTGPGCVGDCAAVDLLPARNEYRTEFAFDVGGGFEVYPTGRTVARVEVGDTMIRHSSAVLSCSTAEGCTSHNVASRIGFGWRF